ncbi:MAG: penicillin acylase family protein [Ferruginibacter sp.]|nr:penicillin acylase family protein [Ferruginibacter sp.]
MKRFLFLLLLPLTALAQPFSNTEVSRWQQQAKSVTVIRDNWGIPHVYGKTDADAVFGLMYAQCEDDFSRIEMNYLEKLGRLSEIKGATELYNDLYLKLIIDSAAALADYKKSPVWLKKLLNSFADGINFYLHNNPAVKPLKLTRFEPWFPLLWTDGSIGAISTGDITEQDVERLYTGNSSPVALEQSVRENGSGSNGFAIAPAKTAAGNSILYINPHVTFYFRPEVHMVSEEGLNVYGAVTWGQFFIYQGFNEYCGWMHTSSNVDVADVYAEKIVNKNNVLLYEYDGKFRPVSTKKIEIKSREGDSLTSKIFTGYFTHHGPVMGKRDGQFLSVKSFNRSLTSLIQSWERTKAKGLADYKKNMELRSNTSNNTVFADNKGNIAYWHGDFVPKRNKTLNWSKVQAGNTSATEWQGLHPVEEIIHVYNPANGWLQNCNSTPFTVAGINSPKKENYPSYMAPDGENFRGINAVRVLSRENAFTIDKTIAAGYDTYLSAFQILVPALIARYEKIQPTDSLYTLLAEPIALLRQWDYHSGENSVATTLAIEWGRYLTRDIQRVYVDDGQSDQVTMTKKFAATASVENLLLPFAKSIRQLIATHGKWQVEWGTINRFQRITGGMNEKFDDSKPSYPVGYASSLWGMLPSFSSTYFTGTKYRYGSGGNSFVCAVEFGKRIKAKSLLAGGESGNPSSPHFADQLEMYTKGKFKDVLFYKEDVVKHAEKTYHPGE